MELLSRVSGVVAGVEQRQQSAAGFTLPPIGVQLPVAVDVAPVDAGQSPPDGHDCHAAAICNQGAWADFGLAFAGLMPKQDICLYVIRIFFIVVIFEVIGKY